ncbi:MAG: DegT/DnrJ/EryC1/StrS family aminotransferase [Ignisphaera sp.]
MTTLKRVKMFEPMIDEEDVEAVARVLRSGWLAHGPEVEAFEQEFADYIGVKYAAAVSNGTVGLMLALKALGIGSDNVVLVPDYTFIATATSVLMVGARPRFVDVEDATFNIDVEDLLSKIDEKVRAIIVVHLFGHPADMKAVKDITEDKKLLIIEDAAQAHGAEAYGKKVGLFGDVAVFSFYATKNMTTGEGGIVVSDNKEVIEKVKLLRNHGQIARYIHAELGGNYRLTSIQAALGRTQLKKLDKMNAIRRSIAYKYNELLKDIGVISIPVEKPWAKHVYHVYALKFNDSICRDAVYNCMLSKGIEVAIHYPLPLHKQPLFKSLGYEECCTNSSYLASVELSIPVHPKLTEENVNQIVNALRECVKQHCQNM